MPCSQCKGKGHNILTCPKRKNNINTNEVECRECPICYDSIQTKNCATTECGHKFCLSCLARSLQENQSCPMCRTAIVPQVQNQHTYEELQDEWSNGFSEGREEGREEGNEESFQNGYQNGMRAGLEGSIQIRNRLEQKCNRLRQSRDEMDVKYTERLHKDGLAIKASFNRRLNNAESRLKMELRNGIHKERVNKEQMTIISNLEMTITHLVSAGDSLLHDRTQSNIIIPDVEIANFINSINK